MPLSIVRDIDVGATWAHLPDGDGVTNDVKATLIKEKKKARRVAAKNKVWTDAQWKEVGKKLRDEKYVKISDTLSHDGTPCVLWTGGAEGGYGRTAIYGVSGLKVHILACTLGNGNVRPEGKEAAHKCGNSLCVEPKHLYFATASENAKDKFKHGTLKTKLSEAQVAEIRELKKKGMSQTALAMKFDVSAAQISRVVNKKMWTHV